MLEHLLIRNYGIIRPYIIWLEYQVKSYRCRQSGKDKNRELTCGFVDGEGCFRQYSKNKTQNGISDFSEFVVTQGAKFIRIGRNQKFL